MSPGTHRVLIRFTEPFEPGYWWDARDKLFNNLSHVSYFSSGKSSDIPDDVHVYLFIFLACIYH